MDALSLTLQHLEGLVTCPTLSGDANDQINDYVADCLSSAGTRVVRIPSPLGHVEGIIASIGPDEPGGLILSGHSDVVPVDGQDWTSDPFQLRRQADKLYGRGSTDMKGFVACAMAVMQSAKADELSAPVHLFLSADEESTCQSVQSLIGHAQATLPPVRGVVVGEPTMMRPVDQHKTSATDLVEVTGHSAHASLAHKGVSATALAARLIVWLENETAKNAKTPGTAGFDPDYSTHTVGLLHGGIANNTVAQNCSFTWDMRLMPGEDLGDVTDRFDLYVQELLCAYQHISPEVQITRTREAVFPGLTPLAPCPFRQDVLAASGTTAFGVAAYGTEAGFFQTAGFDTVVWGPGNIQQAHTADEFIELDQLAGCIQMTLALLR